MSEMIVLIAKAIDADRNGFPIEPPQGIEENDRWKTYSPMADTALQAMENPTEAMVVAGVAAVPGTNNGDVNVFRNPEYVHRIFKAMIAAARGMPS